MIWNRPLGESFNDPFMAISHSGEALEFLGAGDMIDATVDSAVLPAIDFVGCAEQGSELKLPSFEPNTSNWSECDFKYKYFDFSQNIIGTA